MLGQNNFDSHSVSTLFNALVTNKSLQKLHLDHNRLPIEEDSMFTLTTALPFNVSLTYLDLSWNQISDVGGSFLAVALNCNSSLESLILAHNSLTDVCVVAMANCLRVNTSLCELNLFGNNITDAGESVLADSIRYNSSLQWLVLTDRWGENIYYWSTPQKKAEYFLEHFTGHLSLLDAMNFNTTLNIIFMQIDYQGKILKRPVFHAITWVNRLDCLYHVFVSDGCFKSQSLSMFRFQNNFHRQHDQVTESVGTIQVCIVPIISILSLLINLLVIS